jgi:SAM-dependent methyltransferase
VFLPTWSYTGADSALRLFTLANPKLPPIAHGGAVLEIGSCDTDFVKRVMTADPSLTVTGLDQRPYNGKDATGIIQADVLTVDFPPESFDAVCSLSAIEHIGLGRYRDPIDPDGDITAVQRVREWLKPGGFFYFDVPYTPEGYFHFDGTKCRCYDDQALLERFGPHEVLGVATSHCEAWIETPKANHPGARPWWYIALLVRKDGR